MIKVKKLFKSAAGMVMSLALIGSAMPMTASATTYDCDVNDDGAVTVADVTAISKYLAGNLKVPDYNRLDVNKSLIVDNMDVQCVLAERMGWSYDCDYFSRKTQQYSTAPPVPNFIPDGDYDTTLPRRYKKGYYDSNGNVTNTTTYNLYPTTTALSTGTSTYALIGNDDRHLATGSENCGIVSLSNGATGFIVDDHHIATSAHCVFKDGWRTITHINTYNSNGKTTNVKLTPSEVHIPELYFSSVVYNRMYDYALITVEEDLSDYVHFDLGITYNTTSTYFSNTPIYVTGCSQAYVDETPNEKLDLLSCEGRIISKSKNSNETLDNTYILHYNADTLGGNSGSPVYTMTRNIVNNQVSYTYTALTIHGGGIEDSHNEGPRITKYHLQFYRNNSNASW